MQDNQRNWAFLVEGKDDSRKHRVHLKQQHQDNLMHLQLYK